MTGLYAQTAAPLRDHESLTKVLFFLHAVVGGRVRSSIFPWRRFVALTVSASVLLCNAVTTFSQYFTSRLKF